MTQPSDDINAIVIPPNGGQLFKGGPMTLHVIEDGSHTSGTHAVADFAFDGPFSPPPHVHRQHEEVIYVLEGEMGFWVKGETMTLGPGSAFVTPIGLPHTFNNAGSGRLRFLLTASPATHLGYFEQVAELLQKPGPPEPQAMMEIMQKWGLEPIRPS
jgi:mannose-6-phosphate isomerase-like protein (cupin superfamily)